MLAEFYEHLKQENPTHGLEIVFVSSDRDANSFANYYRSMPWLAVPFEALGQVKSRLSNEYQVRGIPFFVVLDAVSGQVVVDGKSARREVMGACQRGEAAIEQLLEDWLRRTPAETQEMIQLLEMSCNEEVAKDENDNGKLEKYLKREPESKEDKAARIKAKFAELVKEGLSPNEAAAKAIVAVSSGPSSAVPLDSLLARTKEVAESNDSMEAQLQACIAASSKEEVQVVLSTALKYLTNLQNAPHNPKFRSFKLGNKVADRITRVPQALQLLDLDIVRTDEDYCGCVPLDADVDELVASLTSLQAE